MSDLLNIVMEDPKVKEEMVSRAKKAIKDITFTKKDMVKIKTAIVDMIIETCNPDVNEEAYYEIQELVVKKMKQIIVDKFSGTIDIKE
ncbi:hypothetical protein KAW18_17345 [candidate division WOR-3 bacterium]|nr:hypothetical protein [candidate division WOR-3 bacterium]